MTLSLIASQGLRTLHLGVSTLSYQTTTQYRALEMTVPNIPLYRPCD